MPVENLHLITVGVKIYKFLNKLCSKSQFRVNPLVSDAHYSERQDETFSLQIQLLEVDLMFNCGFLFFAPLGALMG